jgi:hypothetical protein
MVMRKHLDDDGEIKDGESVTVPIHLMDARQRAVAAKFAFDDADAHRPQHLQLTAEQLRDRRQVRDGYLQDLTSAWRSPAPRGDSATTDSDVDPVQRRISARDEMIKRATTAWRSPHDQKPDDDPDADDPSDPANAVARERELETWQGRDPAELASAVEAQRRKNHEEFARRLANAWRT